MAETIFNYTKRLTNTSSIDSNQNLIRSEFDSGDIKAQRRGTKVYSTFSEQFILSKDQYTAFKNWWTDTVDYGSKFVNHTDPIDATSIEARPTGNYTVYTFDSRAKYVVVELTWEFLQ